MRNFGWMWNELKSPTVKYKYGYRQDTKLDSQKKQENTTTVPPQVEQSVTGACGVLGYQMLGNVNLNWFGWKEASVHTLRPECENGELAYLDGETQL